MTNDHRSVVLMKTVLQKHKVYKRNNQYMETEQANQFNIIYTIARSFLLHYRRIT